MTLSPAAERLGVDQSTATEGDISRAYRRQTLQLHPDKSPGNPIRAAAEFVQLQRDRENLLRAFAARRHARRVAATALRLVSGVRNLYPKPTAHLVPLYPKSPVRETGSGEVSPGLGDGVRLRLRRLPGQRVAAHAA